jgi:hypothetical protein
LDANLLALGANVLVVQVVKGPGVALPPDGCAADCEAAIGADGEAACVDGAGLWWAVELELVVCDDRARAAGAVA